MAGKFQASDWLELLLEWLLNEVDRKRHQAHRLVFKFGCQGKITMSTTMFANESVSGSVSPVDAALNPVQATLSALSFVSSDTTICTVVPDASNPNGLIVTGVPAATATGPRSATITAAATATETDGTTTEQIQGQEEFIINDVTPPPNVAASLVFTFGAPFPTGNPPVTGASPLAAVRARLGMK